MDSEVLVTFDDRDVSDLVEVWTRSPFVSSNDDDARFGFVKGDAEFIAPALNSIESSVELLFARGCED